MTTRPFASHLRRTLLIALTLALLLAWSPNSPAEAAPTRVVFTKHDRDIANPERGFYEHHRCDRPDRDRLNQGQLESYRTQQKHTLVLCLFYLRGFMHSDIDPAALAFFNQQAATVRAAGLKMIVRFAYTDNQPATTPSGQAEIDADLPTIRRHITQLTPFLRDHQAVIAAVQMGFIGKWGEGAYSSHFGNEPGLTDQQWADRREVATALLGAVPSNRMIQIRTPKKKQKILGDNTTPLPSSAAYRGSTAARIGHHNDCFLSNATDSGTYRSPRTADYDYLRQETQFLPMGGETCLDEQNPDEKRQQCVSADPMKVTDAQQELRELHWSYLNWDYDDRVKVKWGAAGDPSGCLDAITRALGYRFALEDAIVPTTVGRADGFPLTFRVTNSGYATPFNERLTYLVLRHGTTGQEVKLKINTDPRRWTAGQTTTVSQTLTLPPTMPTGTYDVGLKVSDATTALINNPAYSIQFANNGLWDAQSGVNRFNHSVTLT